MEVKRVIWRRRKAPCPMQVWRSEEGRAMQGLAMAVVRGSVRDLQVLKGPLPWCPYKKLPKSTGQEANLEEIGFDRLLH